MKILLTFFVLFFSSLLLANDISDFEIEGISIGDSLLDHYTKTQINKFGKTIYPNSDKFYDLENKLTKNNLNYNSISFALKNNDSNYEIYALIGSKFYDNEIDKCKNKKDTIFSDITSNFNISNVSHYDYVYKNIDDGKSISYISEGVLEGGTLRVYCTDWSKVTEDKGNIDLLSIELMTDENADWLISEAY